MDITETKKLYPGMKVKFVGKPEEWSGPIREMVGETFTIVLDDLESVGHKGFIDLAFIEDWPADFEIV